MTEQRAIRTCGTCRHRIDGECRAVPPQIVVWGPGEEASAYPIVYPETPACALYEHDRRSGIQPGDGR